MHLARFALTASIGAVAIAGCNAAGSTPEFTPADSTAVRATVEKWRTTIVAREFDAWATTVTADVVLQPPNLKPLVGRAAATEYIKNYPVITKFDVSVDDLVGRGDLAYGRGTYTLALTLPDGSAASDTGSFLSVFRRQADATWTHDRVTWNSSLPVPAPAPPPARR